MDGSVVLPWQVMCISCLLLSVRRGTASTWSIPTTKRAFLQYNKVPLSLSHNGCLFTEVNHIYHKRHTAVLTSWKLFSQEIPWKILSPLLYSLAHMGWCFRGTCDFHHQSRDGSSRFLFNVVTVEPQCSWTLILGILTTHDYPFQHHCFNIPWLPISAPLFQHSMTAHFSTIVSTFRNWFWRTRMRSHS